MRKIIPYLLIAGFLINSCSSSKHYYKKGNYDMATRKAVEKIRKKPKDEKAIEILKKSYPIANQQDLDRIKFLKQDGNPDIWKEVMDRYNRLKSRQALVKTILPINYSGGSINYKIVDYDKEIVASKQKAAEYFYVHGKKLLNTNDKFEARNAYYEFTNVKEYYSNYKDIDELMNTAREKGMSYVLVKVRDNTIFKLPVAFKNSLIPNDLSPLNTEWVEYSDKPRNNFYDYIVDIQLKRILLSPKSIKEKEYTETKKIEDGWEYVLDQNGNVMKDSLGNDIKRPKIITIACTVKETIQHRDVSIQGSLLYTELAKNRIIKEVKFGVDHFFENRYATANGNLDALKKSTKELLKNRPVPIPLDFDMIFIAGERLQGTIRDALRHNRRVPK